jgi:MFS family permease
MCIAASRNSAGLFATRFFLGFPESGVVPCSVLYFSFWYKPVERAWRIGVFHSANALAAGCSGFLAVGIDKVRGISARWILANTNVESIAQ